MRTGLYILAAGLLLLARPQLLFVLGFQTAVASGWIRVGGVLAALYGAYYVGAAMVRHEMVMIAAQAD